MPRRPKTNCNWMVYPDAARARAARLPARFDPLAQRLKPMDPGAAGGAKSGLISRSVEAVRLHHICVVGQTCEAKFS
jgi:hypothetical protein